MCTATQQIIDALKAYYGDGSTSPPTHRADTILVDSLMESRMDACPSLRRRLGVSPDDSVVDHIKQSGELRLFSGRFDVVFGAGEFGVESQHGERIDEERARALMLAILNEGND